MMHRALTKPQNTPQEVDPISLQMFQDDVVREVRELQDKLTRQEVTMAVMSDRFNRLDTMLTWIEAHRPEAIIDFKTTQNVIRRLDDQPNEADMIKEMQVTP